MKSSPQDQADRVARGHFTSLERDWAGHFSLLNEVFEGRMHMQRIPGGDNHIAFAFVDDGYPPDWNRLKKQTEVLAERIPLDFSGQVKRLRRNTVKPSAARNSFSD